jgi:Ricin-type beta-trefoil lectin domain/Cellulase (glycosyl hydrolase family 5)
MLTTSAHVRRLGQAVTAGLGASVLLLAPATAAHAGTHQAVPPAGTNAFHGVNWADPRDNYAHDPVVPSGLAVTDDYRTVYRITRDVVKGFRQNLGATTLRLPINPWSVGTPWWDSYRGAIDAATNRGTKVILSYWEADTSKDGLVDDPDAWNQMWDTVVQAYGSNPLVYFEPMNEPHGYTLDQWVSVTSGWLARHSDVPRGRVVISGTGYNDDVTGVGATPALDGTLLSLHFYGYWASSTTEADWTTNLVPRIGAYGSRTIIDEAGAPMTIGLNYGAHNGNTYTAYFAALTDTARGQGMGIVYWPGLRTGDSYSIESLGSNGHLTNNSASGVAQLRWGWGFGHTPPVNDLPAAPPGQPVRQVAADRCLDVPGFSTTPGTALDLWDCNNGGNQSWDANAQHELTIYGQLCLAIGGDGASAGSPAVTASCTGATSQQWTVNADGTITSVADSALCLEASGGGTDNGTAVDVGSCTGAANQVWARS